MAQSLRLGLDSFVFFDDNPAEREQVRQALPEVEVVDVPEDPAEYVRALESALYFEAIALTDEDRQRSEQYVVERKRRALEASAGSLDDYLRSLEMVGDVRSIDEADLPRVVQLLAKTNQFNLTTRRHGREEVVELLSGPGAFGVTLRLRDRFGDHGLVAVMIVVPDARSPREAARIDTWLMSCRVIGRTAEQFLLAMVLDCCRQRDMPGSSVSICPPRRTRSSPGCMSSLGFGSWTGPTMAAKGASTRLNWAARIRSRPSSKLAPIRCRRTIPSWAPGRVDEFGRSLLGAVLVVCRDCAALAGPTGDRALASVGLRGAEPGVPALACSSGRVEVVRGRLSGVVLAWLVLKAATLPSWRGLVAALLGGSLVLVLFVVHKLPHAPPPSAAARFGTVLAGIGFSYVALRMIDAIRVLREGRTRRRACRRPSTICCRFTCWPPARSSRTTNSSTQSGVPAPLSASARWGPWSASRRACSRNSSWPTISIACS